jgi:tRNA(Ile)-lysidine synthase
VLQAFKSHILTTFPALSSQKLLLAVSGGLDSMVLLNLCNALNLDIAVAHCNFNLRGNESDADTLLVKNEAERLKLTCHIEHFNTEDYATDKKVSIQIAARELRYHWFEEVLNKFDYDYVLTAHHLNDDIETFIINLTRGTGLDGLSGIPKINQNILRPLLPFSREDIHAYALTHNVKWREDASNASDKYLRNSIRHHIIPKLEDLNPVFLENFKRTQHHLQQSSKLIEDYTQVLFKTLVTHTDKGFSISLTKLKEFDNQDAIVYQLLKTFKFKDWSSVYALKDAQSGKQVLSETHRLIKHQNALLLSVIEELPTETVKVETETKLVTFSMGTLEFNSVAALSQLKKHIAYIDADALEYPLTIRRWEAGDSFQPFGMKGKKKLSDFFKDEKLSLPQKENSYVLTSNNRIVWVIGHRIDHRFRITELTKHITQIVWHF